MGFNKILIIAIVFLIGITLDVSFDFAPDAFALKAKGTSLSQYGSANSPVCGDRLCSELEKQEIHEEVEIQEDNSEILQVEIIPISNNISMLIGMDEFTGGNIGVLAGNDGLLIIDDGIIPAIEGIEMQLKELKTCDECGNVKFLINTHWHFDHVDGNSHFGEQGTVIVAHKNVRNLLTSPQKIEFFSTSFDAYPKDALPVITFDESIFLHFNEETIQVIHVPNGHTNSDSIVYFVESNVLHLGDHFFNGVFPFVDLEHGGSVQGMTKNIEEILNKFPENVKIIPGHGKLGTIEDLRIYHEMLVETTKIVQDQMNDGMNLEEIQDAGLPDKWKSWEWVFIDTPSWINIIYMDLYNQN